MILTGRGAQALAVFTRPRLLGLLAISAVMIGGGWIVYVSAVTSGHNLEAALGYYITPALVGGPTDQMVSSFVASYMNRELNWGMASALGMLLLAITLVIYLVYTKVLGVERMRFG